MLILYYLLLFLVGFFLALGIFNFTLLILNAPTRKTVKTINNLAKKKSSTNSKKAYNHTIDLISKTIYLSPTKTKNMERELANANINLNPKIFLAQAFISSCKFLIPIPIFLILFSVFKNTGIFAYIFLLLSVVLVILFIKYFLQGKKSYIKIMDIKRRNIEKDLPKLVYAINNELQHTHDALSILEKHKHSMNDTFEKELNITIADMRTGNYETALQRLESRISSSTLSEVVRGLIEMIKGNDTKVYWDTLAFRLDEFQKQELRREANKIPNKVQKLSGFVFGFSITVPVLIIMIYEIITNVALIFGG